MSARTNRRPVEGGRTDKRLVEGTRANKGLAEGGRANERRANKGLAEGGRADKGPVEGGRVYKKRAQSSGESDVSIKLSRSQINQVLRAALAERPQSGLPSFDGARRLHDDEVRRALSEHYRSLQSNRRLSRSLLAGLLVLSCFSPGSPELGIKEISERLELNSSTVHRYVATLLAAGLLERDPDTRRYRLLSG